MAILDTDLLLVNRPGDDATYKTTFATLKDNLPAGTIVSEDPPGEDVVEQGLLWFDSSIASLFIWYDDGDTAQWVDVYAGAVSGTGEGASVSVGEAPPVGSSEGDLWWCSRNIDEGGGRLYIYYEGQWIDASIPGGGDDADDVEVGSLQTVTDNGAVTTNPCEFAGGVSVTGGDVLVNYGSDFTAVGPLAKFGSLEHYASFEVTNGSSVSRVLNIVRDGNGPVGMKALAVSNTDDGEVFSVDYSGLTTHAGGVNVTGGTIESVKTGFYRTPETSHQLIVTNNEFRVGQFGNADKSIGFSCNPNGKMSNTEDLAISLIEATYGYGSHGVQELSLFRGAYLANTNCKGSTNCFTAEFRVNQTGSGNRAVGFYSKVNSNDNLNGDTYGFYAEGTAPNYFNGRLYLQNRLYCFVDDAGNDTSFTISTNEGSSPNGGFVLKQDASASSKQWLQQFRITGTEGQINGKGIEFRAGPSTETQRGSITFNNSGGINVNETSDYRTKTNIQPLASAVGIIKTLNPVSYSRAGADNIRGFIAHELQEHVPYAVTGTKDAVEAIGTLFDWDGTELETEITEPGELTYEEQVEATPYVAAVAATYDEYGNELTAEVTEVEATYTTVTRTKTWSSTGTRDVYQGVDQTKLIPLLTKALQEALDEIDSLKTRVNTLEGN